VNVTVVVPKGDQTPESVVSLLEKRGLGSLEEHLTYANVQLALPRFEARFGDSLTQALQGLGMTRAFSKDQADFSGMATAKPLWISDVVHEAVLDVNEKGVEAAAGTAVIMAGAGPPTKSITIRADRPFVVVLSVGTYPQVPLFVAIERDPRDTGD
jgi:serpin B